MPTRSPARLIIALAVAAVSDVTFGIEPGELVALIGPNGAGKSTLFNLISGILKPDTGTIAFDGDRISSLPPHRIAHRGIGLAFQVSNVFSRLSVLENIQVALFSARGKSGSLWSFGPRTLREEAREILGAIGLLAVYGLLTLRGLEVAATARDALGSLLASMVFSVERVPQLALSARSALAGSGTGHPKRPSV